MVNCRDKAWNTEEEEEGVEGCYPCNCARIKQEWNADEEEMSILLADANVALILLFVVEAGIPMLHRAGAECLMAGTYTPQRYLFLF